jgi:hypothetical protein
VYKYDLLVFITYRIASSKLYPLVVEARREKREREKRQTTRRGRRQEEDREADYKHQQNPQLHKEKEPKPVFSQTCFFPDKTTLLYRRQNKTV